MVMWVFSQCSKIGRMEISLPAGSGCKNKKWHIWIQISFVLTPRRYLNLFSVDWGCVDSRVDNFKVTCDDRRPMNLQRNTVKSKDLRKQLHDSYHQARSPLLQTRKKMSEVASSLTASVTFISFRTSNFSTRQTAWMHRHENKWAWSHPSFHLRFLCHWQMADKQCMKHCCVSGVFSLITMS